MALQLTAALEQRLEDLAEETHRPASELAQEALESYLRHVEMLSNEVLAGEESAEREGWLTTEEVFERLNKRVHSNA